MDGKGKKRGHTKRATLRGFPSLKTGCFFRSRNLSVKPTSQDGIGGAYLLSLKYKSLWKEGHLGQGFLDVG